MDVSHTKVRVCGRVFETRGSVGPPTPGISVLTAARAPASIRRSLWVGVLQRPPRVGRVPPHR